MAVNAYELFGTLRADTRQFESALRNSDTLLSSTQKNIESVEKSATNLGKTSATTARFFEKLNEQVGKTASKLQQTANAYNTGTASAKQMANAISQADKSFEGINSRLKDYQARLVDSTKSKTSFVTKLAGAIGIANLASTAITTLTSKLQEGATAILDYSARMEQTRIGFTILMGNAQLANKHLADLKQFALDTPFEFEGLAKASQRLQSVGISTGKILPLMRDLGNIVAATGDISEERFNGITTAISQMISKTKVSAEEMEQLAERGVPAWKILADATGKTQAELRKLSEQGSLSSDVMVAALQKISRERFGDAMEKQSKTFNGAMSNIKDSLMQVAATAFEPLFNQIRDLAVRFAAEIQSKGNDFKAVGNVIAKYIGEGLGIGLEAVIGSLGSFIGTRLKEIFTEGKVLSPLLLSLLDGLGKGLGITGGNAQTAIKSISSNLSEVLDKAKQMPNVAELMKAGEAARQTELLNKTFTDLMGKLNTFGEESEVARTKQGLLAKGIKDFSSATAQAVLKLASFIDNLNKNKKIGDALKDIYSDITQKIQFFGDESEVAQVKQNLLAQGVTDFGTATAQTVIKLAEYYDKLVANKKATDEYNNKLKSLREQITSVRENAQFEMRFPKATDLDKFTNWVERNAKGFKELQGEIKATARELATLEMSRSIVARNTRLSEFFKGIESDIQTGSAIKTDNFTKKLKEMAEAMGLVGQNDIGTGLNVTTDVFAHTVKGLVDTFKIASSIGADTTKIKEAIGNFLATFQTFENGKALSIFAEDQIPLLVDRILLLADTMKRNDLAEGVNKVNDILKDLGLTFNGMPVSKMDEFNQMIADPQITAAIAERAKQLGLTATELTNLMRAQVANESQRNATRPRVVDTESFWSQVSKRVRENMGEMANTARTTAEIIGDSFTSAFDQVGYIFTSAIDSANGFFSGVLDGFKNFAKQLIAEMTAVLVVALAVGAITAAFGGSFTSGFKSVTGSGNGGTGGGILAGIFNRGGSSGSGLGGLVTASAGGLSTSGRLETFATGGFTGFGNAQDIAGIVHKNEYVVNAKSVNALGGASGVEAKLGGNSRPVVVNVNISTPDAESLRRSESQIKRQLSSAVMEGLKNS